MAAVPEENLLTKGYGEDSITVIDLRPIGDTIVVHLSKDARKGDGGMQRPMDRRGMKRPDKRGMESLWIFTGAGSLAALFALLLAVSTAPVLAQGVAGKDLRVFYQQNCAGCHGPDGSAVSAEGKKLSGQNFTEPGWQRDTRDDKMVKTILNGKFFGWAMPAFKDTLTPEEAQRMVTEIIRKSRKGQVIAPDGK
jgi:mono/diheme cytochrome c family protein